MYPTIGARAEPVKDANRRGRAHTRSLAPKEHGAYGQLALPLVTALVSRVPTAGAIALAGAAGLVFFAHEPALVLLGHRGARARSEEGSRCVRRLLVLGSSGTALGVAGLALSPWPARVACAIPLALGAVLAWLVHRRAERTAAGELVAAAALSGAAVPVALAAGVPLASTATAWLTWCVGFGVSTWAVRSVIARQKGEGSSPAVALVLTLAVLGTEAWFWGSGSLMPAAPLVVLAAIVAMWRPHPRHLRRVGWSLVGASVLTSLLLVACEVNPGG